MPRRDGVICPRLAGHFPPNRVATFVPSDRRAVVIIPAGEPSSGAQAAATALASALLNTNAVDRCELGAQDPRGEDGVIVRDSALPGSFFIVVRVFVADASAPTVVLGFFTPNGTPVGATSGVSGVPIDAAKGSASSVGVTREARDSITSVLKEQPGANAPRPERRAEPLADDEPRRPRFELALLPVRLPLTTTLGADLGATLRFTALFSKSFGVYASAFYRFARIDPSFDSNVEPPLEALLSVDALLSAGVAFNAVSSRSFVLTVRGGLAGVASSALLKPVTLRADGTTSTTRLWRSRIGPPEFPGLRGICVWKTGLSAWALHSFLALLPFEERR